MPLLTHSTELMKSKETTCVYHKCTQRCGQHVRKVLYDGLTQPGCFSLETMTAHRHRQKEDNFSALFQSYKC